MATVTIDAVVYTTYATLAATNSYLNAAAHADAWRDATDTEKSRAIVTAARTLDRQLWRDDYNTFAEREVVANIITASMEMAAALIDGSELQNVQNNTEKVRSMSAGSVSITLRNTDNEVTRFPQIVHELLRDYLLGESFVVGSKVVGVDTETAFPLDIGLSSGH